MYMFLATGVGNDVNFKLWNESAAENPLPGYKMVTAL